MVNPEENPLVWGANLLHLARYCNRLVSVTSLSFSPPCYTVHGIEEGG